MPDTAALRVEPGARIVTPLCRAAQELAALQGWRRYASAFALGALLAAALPPVDLTPVVFAVFPLYLWLDDGSRSATAAARLAYVFALGHFTAGMYWVAAALFVDIGQFWWALPFAVLGLPALLALFVAACLWVAALARFRLQLSGFARICAFAAMWSVAEWLRGHLFTGLPWNLIGYVWAGGFPGAIAMLQATAWVGIYGLGFVTVLAAALPALLGTPSLSPLGPLRRALPALAAAALILVPAGVGALRLALAAPSDTGIWLRLVQPSIAQTAKWDPAAAEANFRRLVELSSAPATHRLAAVIWPEAAVTFFLERDATHRAAVAAVAPQDGYVLTGALRGAPLSGPLEEVWNSVEAIDRDGRIRAHYDKAHLVPFGEYMPWRDILPLHKLTAGSIDLSAGPGPRTLTLDPLPPFSPLICYEAIFPGAAVDPHERPAWLLNVSNDAWYGRSAGPYQHFAMARTRAVEEGLPLVRVANNGISGVVDPEGRVLARTGLDAIGYADIDLPAAAPQTPYGRLGDWVFLAMLLAAGGAALGAGLARRAG
ncbi:MAG TPA: apolipoprotein N-acyltransferase [Stellaceae bacterium]|nr:apolipoprotein N-acyltransferase [Stellaceae bacterium]